MTIFYLGTYTMIYKYIVNLINLGEKVLSFEIICNYFFLRNILINIIYYAIFTCFNSKNKVINKWVCVWLATVKHKCTEIWWTKLKINFLLKLQYTK